MTVKLDMPVEDLRLIVDALRSHASCLRKIISEDGLKKACNQMSETTIKRLGRCELHADTLALHFGDRISERRHNTDCMTTIA